MRRLSLLISTIDDRLVSVKDILLPISSKWQYIIVWQHSEKYIPSEVIQEIYKQLKQRKEDLFIIISSTTGLSTSRNLCFELWKGTTDLALLVDDDMRYTVNQLCAIIDTFDNHPEIDMICGQVYTKEGKGLKQYPTNSFPYANRHKGYYISSVEIALRYRETIPSFDVRFGLGAPLLCAGEEEVFVHTCFKEGWSIHYIPQIFGTTNNSITTPNHPEFARRMQYTKGAVLKVLYGAIGGGLRLLKSAFYPLRIDSLIVFARYMKGFLYI